MFLRRLPSWCQQFSFHHDFAEFGKKILHAIPDFELTGAAKTAWIVFGILAALLALVQINVHRSARQMGESGEVMQRDMAKQMEQIQKQIEEGMKKHPPQPEQQ